MKNRNLYWFLLAVWVVGAWVLVLHGQDLTQDQVAANLEFYPCRDSTAPLVCADVMMITPNDQAKVCINDQDPTHCVTVGELKTFEEARNAGQVMGTATPPPPPPPPCTVTVTVVNGVTHVATEGCS